MKHYILNLITLIATFYAFSSCEKKSVCIACIEQSLVDTSYYVGDTIPFRSCDPQFASEQEIVAHSWSFGDDTVNTRHADYVVQDTGVYKYALTVTCIEGDQDRLEGFNSITTDKRHAILKYWTDRSDANNLMLWWPGDEPTSNNLTQEFYTNPDCDTILNSKRFYNNGYVQYWIRDKSNSNQVLKIDSIKVAIDSCSILKVEI